MGDEETFDDENMKKNFLSGTLNKSPATFSMAKLLWFNKYYLDQMNEDKLIEILNQENFDGSQYSKDVINAVRDRCETINDFSTNSFYFFDEPSVYDEALILKHCKKETYGHLSLLRNYLDELENWKQSLIKDVIDSVASELDVGFGKIGLPLRLALTANTNSPSIDLVCELLGKEASLKRLDSFLINIKDQEKTL